MTYSEKNQLIKGLFLTTGIVLGVMFNQVEDGTGGILFSLLSVALFFAAFFIPSKTDIGKVLLYSSAIALWFIMYKLFRLM